MWQNWKYGAPFLGSGKTNVLTITSRQSADTPRRVGKCPLSGENEGKRYFDFIYSREAEASISMRMQSRRCIVKTDICSFG